MGSFTSAESFGLEIRSETGARHSSGQDRGLHLEMGRLGLRNSPTQFSKSYFHSGLFPRWEQVHELL